MLNITSSNSRHWTGRKIFGAWGSRSNAGVKEDGTVNPEYFNSCVVDSDDNIIAIGNYSIDTTLPCADGVTTAYQLIIVKFSKDGTILWQRNIDISGTTWSVEGMSVAVDSSNNIYVFSLYITDLAPDPYPGYNGLITKLNTDGGLVFNTSVYYGFGNSFTAGNIVTTNDGFILSSRWNTNTDVPAEKTILITKYDFDGNVIWNFSRDAPTLSFTDGYKVISSNTSSDFFLVMFNNTTALTVTVDRYSLPTPPSTTPSLVFSKQLSTSYVFSNDRDTVAVALSDDDNIYVSFGIQDIASQVLVKMDSSASLLWAKTYDLPLTTIPAPRVTYGYLVYGATSKQNNIYFYGEKTETNIGNDVSLNFICKFDTTTDTFSSLALIRNPLGEIITTFGSTEAGAFATDSVLSFCGWVRTPLGDQAVLIKLPSELTSAIDEARIPGEYGWEISIQVPPSLGTDVTSNFTSSSATISPSSQAFTTPARTFSINTISNVSPAVGNFTRMIPIAPSDPIYPNAYMFKLAYNSTINTTGPNYTVWNTIETVDCGGPTLFGIVSTSSLNQGQQQFTISLRAAPPYPPTPVGWVNNPSSAPSFTPVNTTIFTSPWASSTITRDITSSIVQDIYEEAFPGNYNLIYRTKDSPTHYVEETYPTICTPGLGPGGTPTGNQTYITCKGSENIATTIDGNTIPDVPWTTDWSFVTNVARDIEYLNTANFVIPEEKIATASGAAQIKYVFQSIFWCQAQISYVANYVFDSILVYPKAVVTTKKTVPGTNLTIRSNIYEGGQYVMAASQGTMFTSPDSNTWTQQTNIAGITDSLRSIAYGNGTYVVVGSAGKIATSTNGTSWTARTSGTTQTLNRVGFGNNTFLAVGRTNTILRSTNNGTSWSFITVTGTFRGIVYNSVTSTWVAVGDNGAILTSTDDGVSWTARTSGTTNQLWTVSVINDVYYTVGQNGTIIKSNDAITWSTNLNDSGNTGFLNAISYGNGVYLVSGDSGILFQSNTGINGWYSLPVTVAVDLNSILFRNNQFNIAGSPSAGSSVLLGTNTIV